MSMFDKVKEINDLFNEVHDKNDSLKIKCKPRLEYFVERMSKIEDRDPNKKTWSSSRYPHSLEHERNFIDYKLYFNLSKRHIEVSWRESDYHDSRGDIFIVHDELFEDNYEQYVDKRCEEYYNEVERLIELDKENKRKKLIKEMERQQKELDKLAEELED